MNQDLHKSDSTDQERKKERTAFYEATRRILLASIGAAMLAQEEIEAFINRLIERGEMAENDARRLVREVKDRRERMEAECQERKLKSAGKNPEIELLAARINELTRQIEELRCMQQQKVSEESTSDG